MASILFKMVTWYSLLTASLLFYLPIANAKPYNSWLEFAKRSHGEHTHHSPLTIHQRGYKGGRSTINSTSSISPGGLPTNIIPKHYDVTIEPDSSYLEFNGVVIIDLDVVQDSNSITFNSARLNLTGTNLIVSSKTGQSWQWSNPNITIDTKASTTTLVFPRILEASTTAELQIWFRGTIADANDTSALYRQPFTTGNGTVEYLLSTQFEAEDARRVFPCWDEPLFKANFTVTLIIPNNVTAVSNMPIDSEASLVSNGTTKKSVRFKTTPRMSSYLVAWAIGRFQYIESTDYKMPIRVYFAPDQDPAGMRYTLSVATKTMDFFEAKLGVPYPLPKLDFIVHTHQLWGYSGMENWGLITLSSTVVYDMTSSSYSGKQGSTTLTAHEISHLWFGDIVTMTWWDNIWLNEGFARYMEILAADNVDSGMRVWDDFVLERLQGTLGGDASLDQRPLQFQSSDPGFNYFSSFVYDKGACVLRMLSAALGQDKFMSGLGIYLRQNAYSNTVPADLWQGLSSASNTDVAGLMNTWVTQPGFPLITVTESNKTISLEQHRFVSTGNLSTAADILYPVPIGLRTQHGVTRSVFSERTTTLELNDDMDFFYLNSDSMGYWRTKYTPDRLRKLGQQAKRLTVAERIGLVGDTSALVEAGHYNASAFLGLISQMKDEDDVFVWKPMIQEIKAYQSRWMGSTDIAGKLDELVRNITGSLADKLGQQSSNQSDYFQQQLYTTIFETAGLSGVPSIVQTSKSMLRDMVNNNASVANVSPLKDAAMAISLKHGGTEEYNALLNYAQTTTNHDYRRQALSHLGASALPELVNRTISMMLDSTINPFDLASVAEGITESGGYQVDTFFRWVMANYDQIHDQYTAANSTWFIGYIAVTSVGRIWTREQLNQAISFYNGSKALPSYALPGVQVNVERNERDMGDLKAWAGL